MGIALFSSCVEDNSAYIVQEKENVAVDPPADEPDDDPELGPNDLRPGINTVTLSVNENGTMVSRRFKYYLPASVKSDKPISLIFNFHGSYTYTAGSPAPDPLAGVSQNDTFNQLAAHENCITVFPAGEVLAEAVNWQNSEKHLPFVDAMLDYFSTKNPLYDADRVYTCGHSSGAIFSFYLAFKRSGIFAAAVPVSGQMALTGQTDFPQAVVPIRAFNGTTDASVVYSAALNNITIWAEKVAGYYPVNAAALDTLNIEGYKKVACKVWRGGSNDIEFFSVIDEGHSISWARILPYMWEFMSTHVRNQAAIPLFVNASKKEIALREGETTTLNFSHTSGAVFTHNIPAEWNPVVSGNTITLKAPDDFFSCEYREGNFTLTAKRGSESKQCPIAYKLIPPKAYFEVGDVYYVNNKAVGVVVWVNNKNIKEAKIISLEIPDPPYGNMYYNGGSSNANSRLGAGFETPSTSDGAGNTAAMMAKNPTLTTPNTASSSLWVWSATRSPEGTSGWYLPAIDELGAVYANLARINNALTSVSSTTLSGNHYSSTVKLNGATGLKDYYYINYANGSVLVNSPAGNSEYMGYVYGRAFRKVTM